MGVGCSEDFAVKVVRRVSSFRDRDMDDSLACSRSSNRGTRERVAHMPGGQDGRASALPAPTHIPGGMCDPSPALLGKVAGEARRLGSGALLRRGQACLSVGASIHPLGFPSVGLRPTLLPPRGGGARNRLILRRKPPPPNLPNSWGYGDVCIP
jgi:hypothetical protein